MAHSYYNHCTYSRGHVPKNVLVFSDDYERVASLDEMVCISGINDTIHTTFREVYKMYIAKDLIGHTIETLEGELIRFNNNGTTTGTSLHIYFGDWR